MAESIEQPIYLASRSPRRHELLGQIGISFEQIPGDIDEATRGGEAAEHYVERMARGKALAGMHWLQAQSEEFERRPILAADTIVVVDDEILGKPVSRDHSAQMLRRLSDRTHRVMTAIAVAHGAICQSLVQISEVCFAPLDEDWISRYWETGEPADKAGSYGVQGIAGARVVEIRGSYFGVMGLPLFDTVELLEAVLKRTQGERE